MRLCPTRLPRPWAVALCLLAAWPAPLVAAPVITVRGQTVIRLLGIQRTAKGALLIGQLQDRDLSTGVPEREVTVSYRDADQNRTLRTTTNQDGVFRAVLPGGSTSFQVSARFDGDLTYAEESYPAERLDVTKQTLELALASNAELDAGHGSQQLHIEARVGADPAQVLLSVRTDRGRDLGQLQTDARGRATITVPTIALGAPGRFSLFVNFAGNERFNPTYRRFELALTTPVQVSLRAREQQVEAGDPIHLEGEVHDITGPLAGATVQLEVLGRQTANAVTNAAGRFSFRQEAADYPPGRIDMVVRFAPSVSWRRAAGSAPLDILITLPRPIPLRLYLAPALVTCLLLLVVMAVRRGSALLEGLRTRFARDSRKRPSSEVLTPLASGLQRSRSSAGLRALVHQAQDFWGMVWDPTERRPIPGATLQLTSSSKQLQRVAADAAGRFMLKSLPPGVHQVSVSCPGYITEEFDIRIPHRGQLHDVKIELVQVRVRLLELYREATLPLLPQRELWARWTPRELARHVGARAGRRHAPLEELTFLVERAYWSGRPPPEELLSHARSIVSDLREGIG